MATDETTPEPLLLKRLNASLTRGDVAEATLVAEELLENSAAGSVERCTALVHLSHVAVDEGRVAAALEMALEAKASIGTLPVEEQVDLLNGLTVIYGEIGDRPKTLEYSVAALEAARMGGAPDRIFYAYNNLGYFYLVEGVPSRALDYFERGRFFAEGQPRLLALLMRNLSQVYIDTGRLDLAADHAERALYSARRSGDLLVEQYALYSQAQIARLRGDRNAAVRLYEEALSTDPRLELRVFCLSEMASSHRSHGDIDAAIGCLERLLAELDGGQRVDELLRCHEELSVTYRAAGRLVDALDSLEHAYRLQAIVREQRSEEQIRALDIEHRMEMLQHESELLRRKNDELARLNEVVRELSIRDELTGLYNRRHLFEQAETLTRAALRYRRPLSVAMIDIDHFKRVNDVYGHGTGDAVLRAVGDLLVATLREADLVARYGGEEFVVVMPETPLHDAVTACDRIRDAMAAADWGRFHPGMEISVSAGVAALSDGGSWDATLAEADENLLGAKRAGRNRVVAFDPATA